MQDSEAEYWQLVETFAASDIAFLRVKTDTFELVLSRNEEHVDQRPHVDEAPPRRSQAAVSEGSGPLGAASPPAPAPEPPDVAEANAMAVAVAAEDSPSTKHDVAKDADTVIVASPSVGVVYRAPSPDASPYVEVGSVVEPGTTIALIEAMKVFTAVSAGVSGTIAEILVENNAFVEFGQPLFAIVTEAQDASA